MLGGRTYGEDAETKLKCLADSPFAKSVSAIDLAPIYLSREAFSTLSSAVFTNLRSFSLPLRNRRGAERLVNASWWTLIANLAINGSTNDQTLEPVTNNLSDGLRRLTIQGDPFSKSRPTDSGLQNISRLHHLKHLVLSDCDVSGEILAEFVQNTTDLSRIDLSNNLLDDFQCLQKFFHSNQVGAIRHVAAGNRQKQQTHSVAGTIAKSRTLTSLTSLDLSSNANLTELDLSLLSQSHLKVDSLKLAISPLDSVDRLRCQLRALFRSRFIQNCVSLTLHLKNASMDDIISSLPSEKMLNLRKLKFVGLSGVSVDCSDVDRLLTDSALEPLQSLSVRGCLQGDDTTKELRKLTSCEIRNLVSLDLENIVGLTADSLAPLAESPDIQKLINVPIPTAEVAELWMNSKANELVRSSCRALVKSNFFDG